MGKTRRRKKWGEPGHERDGKTSQYTSPPTRVDHALYNKRPARRQEARTAWMAARGWDADELMWPGGGRRPNWLHRRW